jgi:transposase
MLRVSVGQQRSFLDAVSLAPNDKRFEFARFYAREILPLVTDRDFEDLYSELGRGAVSPALLFHALILAKIEGLSDRQAAQAVGVRLDWKVALGLRVDNRGFDPTRFVRFRSRFLDRDSTNDHQPGTADEKKRIRILFDRIIETVIKYGLIKKDQAIRLDSTHIVSAAKNINRYQTVFESILIGRCSMLPS